MLILEHDAKEIFAAHGVAIPAGLLAGAGDTPAPSFVAPWFVKAQVPAGGRGKAGGIVRVETVVQLTAALDRLNGAHIKGHRVRECRVEQAVDAWGEAYLSLSVDPATGQIHVLIAPEGGVDIEEDGHRGLIAAAESPRDADAIRGQVRALAEPLDEPVRSALIDAGGRLAAVFCELEATLLEVNPLLVMEDRSWLAGDAKVIVDENAFVRRPEMRELVQRRAEAYPEAARKLAEGFDYVELDPDGDIALVTTGAGLSMQLIDELLERGCRPFNFCDIRSGNFRGDPTRLIRVLEWIAAGRSVRSVLVNFFAGITHLGELSRLLLTALEAVPELRAPLTVRLVGNGLEEARAVLLESQRAIAVEPDLEKAVAQAIANLRADS